MKAPLNKSETPIKVSQMVTYLFVIGALEY